ncbi:hematopoietic prostaglandin D synthase [Bombina bombina]|uniref:hematopoietic prostaglandin D synthase n=1 Tax=Bombina bombina TaxID=8345 RepID=UPI00235B03D6|nr:hematopoietic prostaglandin D synthase [Bombina bombina]XP_053559409.1 hematopoietic prostaglandin D synthase [Bombina bombina]XP_053559410.1 hematopoietic prostaglandin D synthase [Bombina bombina]XP_053559412.1 hematopoietic prostaglandin D synthase [Bombina bombina]XP_053559413.1 hematopoietic prostaglandin D synthase [Bombina bombina]
MPNYKLIYFNFRGRGEIIRYLFAYLNQEYEDRRIEFPDWPAIKPTIPYGKLPVLEIDGVIYHQSLAVGRYLAKKAGLAGKSDLEQLRVDAIIASIDDFISEFPWEAENEAEKKRKQTEYVAKVAPDVLSSLEKSLGDHVWFVGDSVTWADFSWDICSDGIEGYVPGFADKYVKLKALKERVKAIPAIAAWVKKRPHTEA